MLFPVLLFAQVQTPVQLNQIIETTGEQGSLAKSISSAQTESLFRLNTAVFEDETVLRKGSRFLFSHGDGTYEEYIIQRSSEYFPGVKSVVARAANNKQGLFSFSYSSSEGMMVGLLHQNHDKAYRIGFDKKQKVHFLSAGLYEEDVLACGLHEDTGEEFLSKSVRSKSKVNAEQAATFTVPSRNTLAATVDDSVRIDLMIAYTQEAETWAADTSSSGNIETVIAEAVNRGQLALDNSNTGIELRLVHAYKTSYSDDETDTSSSDHLRRLTQNPSRTINFCSSDDCDSAQWSGYMNEAHTLRAMHGADVVALIAHISDTGGLGWRLSNLGGSYGFAFNVNRVQQVAGGYTLIHEIGHNMGNAHSRTQDFESRASDSGGLFHYSAGYQNRDTGFHTVMAYGFSTTSGNSSPAPLFSSPDLSFEGGFAGTSDLETPSDNARSLKDIKRTIAAYETPKLDMPVSSVSTNSISIEMNREDQLTEAITISNGGASVLTWDVDFNLAAGIAKQTSRSKQTPSETIKAKEVDYRKGSRSNLSPSLINSRAKTSSAQLAGIYETSFEASENFEEGRYEAISEWRTLAGRDFDISSENPSGGSNHLRMEYGSSSNLVSTPYWGVLPFGSYEITMDIAFSAEMAESEQFQAIVYDGSNNELTSGVIIAEGNALYGMGAGEVVGETFNFTEELITTGEYSTIKIQHDAQNGELKYYLNGNLVRTEDYADGVKPDYIEFGHYGGTSGTYIDIDNVSITQLSAPYPWLELNAYGGSVLEGTSGDLELTFNTEGIPAGDYQASLRLFTNDDENKAYTIPVSLTVLDVVSNEEESGLPAKLSLAQNYPNPFNPVTTITYSLAQNEQVHLDVFNIQGQKVATLVNSRQTAGEYDVRFDASDLASGIYMYRISTPSQTITRQMVLIK